MVLSIIALILSGLYIRFPGTIPWATMNTARFIHFVSMYVLIFSWIAYTYHTLRIEWSDEVTGCKDLKAMPGVLKYYLILTDEHPVSTKYNPIQKISYNIVWFFILVQIITVLPLYWPSELMWLTAILGGPMAIRILHDFMTYLFIAFLFIHVYLVLTDDIRSLWAMFHGYYYRKVNR
jgi:Ni/Fe-hydrogenase 1 B-type cytochrome subunit